MTRFRLKIISLSLAVLLAIPLFLSCSQSASDTDRISAYASPYKLNIFTWEVKNLAKEIFEPVLHGQKDSADSEEKLIESRVREEFSAQGIYNPAGNFLKIGFPPMTLFLGPPPDILIVSPRDKIEAIDEITLKPNMTAEEMAKLEGEIEKLGYSALVDKLGGLATVPAWVSNEGNTKFILESTAHEWVHQYLAFTPLGFRYVMDETGIQQNADVITLNETVADIIGNEIGNAVYQKYYALSTSSSNTTVSSSFDFNSTMRNIRKTVDKYLAKDEIDAAEKYMNEQRDYLAANGYNIRKLNQAYFAFYGTYADSPTSSSPIGGELNNLRNRSASLKDFLDKVSGMTSMADLEKAVR
ncbi:MAG TPA: hypothetical protein VMB24_05985 [Dehalococcoidales bacterium]|nr:hypothetical protein [Dehalococcoidales bacterium]